MVDKTPTPAPATPDAGAASSELGANNSQNTNDEPVVGNTEAAIEFLRKWAEEGPWVLAAIDPNHGRIIVATFDSNCLNDIERWIDQYNGIRNIYFHVNPTMQKLNRKASRKDIKELRWLHVDIDPRPPETGMSADDVLAFLAAEQERCLGLLKNPPSGVPQPTVIVFSGGGYQGFWRLREAFLIGGDIALAEEASLWTKSLENVFGADNCRNVDRIMRLPGTVNLPDAKKLEKGRIARLARVIEFNNNVYDLSVFSKASIGGNSETFLDDMSPDGSGLESLDGWYLTDGLKLILATGSDPSNPDRWDGDRSRAVYFVACELIRKGLPKDVIVSVLTNPKLGISAHVLEQTDSTKYARRQVDRAWKRTAGPILDTMNEEYFAVNDDGGKARVGFYRWQDGRTVIATQSYPDFKRRFENKTVTIDLGDGKSKEINRGVWWLKHPARREYEGIVFAPNSSDVPRNYLNLWRGFAVEPRQEPIPLITEHLRVNICGDDETDFGYLWRWLAWKVQNPGLPCEVAIVLRGGRGTGKSTVGHIMRKLFGQHGMTVASSAQFTGRFNGHFQAIAFLFADEAVKPNDKDAESRLKAYITERTLALEKKNVDVMQMPNCMGIMLATNDEWAVPAGTDERRFAVYDVVRRCDKDWFARLYKEIADGGLEGLLFSLLNFDLGEWHPRLDVPQNAALAAQKARSLGELESAVLAMLESGEPPDGSVFRGDGRLMLSGQEFVDSLHTRQNRRSIEVGLRLLLVRKLGLERPTTRFPVVLERGQRHVRRRGYVLPPLSEMRERWCRKMGMDIEWDDLEGWSDPAPGETWTDEEVPPF